MDFGFDVIGAGIHTDVDEATAREAQAAIEAEGVFIRPAWARNVG
jgi:hypothetical protein